MTSPRTAVVLISSTRAATGVYEDSTGPLLAGWLSRRGFAVAGPVVRADGADFAAALAEAIAGRGAADGAADGDVAPRGVSPAGVPPDFVVTSGGTGISPTDVTPQLTEALLDYQIPGLAEALRRRGVDSGVPTAVLSRGVVGVAGRTLVVNLPGSTGGVKDGIAVLDEVLDHALDQLAGGDHVRQDADSQGGRHE